MPDCTISVAIILIPFVVFIVTGLFGGRMKPLLSGLIGTAGMLSCFGMSLYLAFQYFFINGRVDGIFKPVIPFTTLWLRFSETLHIDLGVLLDPISVMMLVVVTGISLMVHIYSLEYMKGDSGFSRYFSFLSLFSFSMVGLVVATNIFQMYMFWELVGVSSYLLIGFYYDKDSAVRAAKKAFIVTRFADLGFLIGILIISFLAGSFDFSVITNNSGAAIRSADGVAFLGLSLSTWALMLIFMGGAGKSAMFPLHIWLPDAMEGPTPVSALIHAATMVVAGVYLVARLFAVYALTAPQVLDVVAWVGGISSLFAAIIACTQTDIKRVLAYSTMSQIGYMMLALGVSGYGAESGLGYMASMFHLFTHAMFKALLFLCVGSVIHALHTNDMSQMGGLRSSMPITHVTFLVACLAISGIPPFAGFFSKDEILVAAFEHNTVLFILEYIVAGLTAFYMFRLYFRVFWGQDREYTHVPHESPFLMTVPLVLLAIASSTVGFIPFSSLVTSDGAAFSTHIDWMIAGASIAIAVAGIVIARLMYIRPSDLPQRVASTFRGITTAAFNKFYIDEVYMFVTKRIIFQRIAAPVAWFDRHIVDGSMNAIASTTNEISEQIKSVQSGQLQWYALVTLTGVVALLLVYLTMN